MGVRSGAIDDAGGVTYARRGCAGVLVREPCNHCRETRANIEEEEEEEEEEEDVGGIGATHDTPLPFPMDDDDKEDRLVYTP